MDEDRLFTEWCFENYVEKKTMQGMQVINQSVRLINKQEKTKSINQ